MTTAARAVAQPALPPPPADQASRPPDSGSTETHVKRGVYLHAAMGPGLLFAVTDSSQDARRFFGTSVAFQLAVAGRLGRNVVLGGAYFRDQLVMMSVHDEQLDGDEPNLEDIWFSFDRAGVLLGVFPNPDEGLHFQGFVGFGDLNTHRPDGDEVDDPSGVVLSAAGGYEWFASERWRLGALARLTYAPLHVTETGSGTTNLTTWLPTLLVSATYH